MASVESVPAYMLPGVPVVQPAHLEGDASLATEILPGPPSLLSIQQASLPRRDHRKSVTVYSYLPTSDPGTTYTGHLMSPLVSTTEVDGPRRKRARMERGSATSRAQRASARNLNANVLASDTPVPVEPMASSSLVIPDSDPLSMALDSDEPALSRSNSLPNPEDSVPASSNLRSTHAPRRDKGKGREKEFAVRVKEEPSVVSLPTMSDSFPLGAFHLWCLDPPMEQADLPEGETRWFCPSCTMQQKPPPRPSSSLRFMVPLIEHLQTSLPVEFQLPQDIRTYFKDVATGPRGTYVDSSELKPPRLNRHGQLEERDPYRLKDRNGEPILCFRCGTSALPPGVAASAPAAKRARRETMNATYAESGRSIISCDYCHLHWHLDCVDPPLSFMPPWGKKWMCPNHADRLFQPKRRIPKANAAPIEITKPHQPNNGNIEIIQPESAAAAPSKMVVDEVLINGRRYRVPERIITLDFWDKISKNRGRTDEHTEDVSTLSSPLTSLSSLAEDDEVLPNDLSAALFSVEDIEVAQLLAGLQLRQRTSVSARGSVPNETNDTRKSVTEGSVGTGGSSSSETKTPGHVNGVLKSLVKSKAPALESRSSTIDRQTEVAKPRRSLMSSQPDTARLTKRASRRDDEEYVPVKVEHVPVAPTRPRRSLGRKGNSSRDASDEVVMALDSSQHLNGSSVDDRQPSAHGDNVEQPLSTSNPVAPRPKRVRQPTRKRLSPIPLSKGPLNSKNSTEHRQVSAESEEPDTPLSILRSKVPASNKKPKVVHIKAATPPPVDSKTLASTPVVSAVKTVESTPTLKIRLPRLGSLNVSSISAPPPAPPADTHVPALRGRPRKSSRSAPRRTGRRQASSASLNEASASSEAL